jgi:FkbM family methyltransferase
MNNIRISPTCQITNLKEIYLQYFNKTNGCFVEVGAFNGESFSNTSGLADLGWTGIYIEPVPDHMDQCKQRHQNNNVQFEQCAIGNSNNEKKIHVAGGLSTLSDTMHAAHKNIFEHKHFNNESELIVPTTKLDTILHKHNISKDFDLLVVDVEGYEQEVFESFSLEDFRPKMIIAELSDIHSGYDNYPDIQRSHKLIRNLLVLHGYKEIYADAINTIFYNTYEQKG